MAQQLADTDEWPEVPPRRQWDPGTGWRTVRTLGLLLIVLPCLVLFWTPAMAWGEYWVLDADGGGFGHSVPSGYAILGMLVLGPALSFFVAAFGRRWSGSLLGAAGAAVLCLIALAQLAKAPGDVPVGGDLRSWGVPPYGPLTVLAGVALTLGWLLFAAVAVVDQRSGRTITNAWGGRSAVVYGTVLVLFAAGGFVGIHWYATHRGIDRVTARPLRARPAGLPRDLGTIAWRDTEDEPVRVVGPYLIAAEPDGIVVRDALTGRQRWHYHRAQAPDSTPDFDVTADGRTLLTLWPRYDRQAMLAGFDLATGALRWSNAQHGADYGWSIYPIDRLAQIGDTVIVTRTDGLALGISTVTGRQLWRWQPDAGCEQRQFLAVGGMLTVAVDCSGTSVSGGRFRLADGSFAQADTRVLGISPVDGSRRWSWKSPSAVSTLDYPGMAEPGMAAVGDTLRVATRLHGDITLDPRTGAESHPDADRAPRPSGGQWYTVLRGPDTTVYLGDGHGHGGSSGVDPAGTTRWAADLPALDGMYVSASAVLGDTGYALLLPADPSGRMPPSGWQRRLLALNLSTGAVLASEPVDLPGDCLCMGISYPPDVRLFAANGVLVIQYATSGPTWSLVAYR